MPEVQVAVGEGKPLFHVLKEAGLTSSTSEAMRMVDQGAVRIDGERVEDRSIVLKAGESHVMQVGRRKFARVVLN